MTECRCVRNDKGEITSWCSPCLKAKVRAARAALDPCRCNEIEGAHRHA